MKKTYVANLPARTLVGFFPDPTTRREIIVVRHNFGARVLPGINLRVENGEWCGYENPLAAEQLEQRPLVLVEGDVRFIRILLELVSAAMTSNRWQSEAHAEKWAIALRLSKWLREPKANWGRRAAELYRMLKRGLLMPNTLQQKVKRLLAYAG